MYVLPVKVWPERLFDNESFINGSGRFVLTLQAAQFILPRRPVASTECHLDPCLIEIDKCKAWHGSK